MLHKSRYIPLVRKLTDVEVRIESLVVRPLSGALERHDGRARASEVKEVMWHAFQFMPEVIGQAREQAEDDVDERIAIPRVLERARRAD